MKAIMTIIVSLLVLSVQGQHSFEEFSENVAYNPPQSNKAIALHYENLADTKNCPELYFNAACYWTLAADHQNAFRCLFYIASNGFRKLNWLEQETDLEPLRSTGMWRLVILKVKSNIKEYNIELKQNGQDKVEIEIQAPESSSPELVDKSEIEYKN